MLAEIHDKQGSMITLILYSERPVSRKKVIALYGEGSSDSFDRRDMKEIKDELDFIEEDSTDQDCLLAFEAGELVGAAQFYCCGGTWDNYEISYIFVAKEKQKNGIGRILCGTIEEFVKKKARLVYVQVAGLLPHYANPYPFWVKLGYLKWGELQGGFRDDLSSIYMVKRNLIYKQLKGIPQDDRWYPEMVDVQTGRKRSEEEYYQIVNEFKSVPKEKWGLNLIGRENVLTWNI